MHEIIDLIKTYDEYVPMVIYASAGILIITFVVNLLTGSIKFAKYIPGLIALGMGFVILLANSGKILEKESLKDLVLSMTGIGSGIIGLCFALILGIVGKKLKINKTKKSNSKTYGEDY